MAPTARNASQSIRSISQQIDKNEINWTKAHDDAVKLGKEVYVDPTTGYQVFTSISLMKKGYCCGNVCRHCPFNYENVGKTKPEMKAIVQEYRKTRSLSQDW
jgi:hypothetical protein